MRAIEAALISPGLCLKVAILGHSIGVAAMSRKRSFADIDAVMAAQADLVEIVHTLRQVVCVKG